MRVQNKASNAKRKANFKKIDKNNSLANWNGSYLCYDCRGVKEIKVLVSSAQNAPFNMISSSNGT